MEAPLVKAHADASAAEEHADNGQWAKASAKHQEAAEAFDAASKCTRDAAVARFMTEFSESHRQRADACAERAKRRWPTSASSTPNDVLRSAASGSAAHFNSAREAGEGGSGSGSGPSSSSKATSVSVAGSYYFVGGRSILGSGTSGTSGTHNSAMTQPKSLARGSAGGHDDPLANSRKMQGSSADARIASGGGSAVRVRNRNGNGLGSLQEEAAATPAADGGGGDASLEHGSGEGGVGHTVAENSTEDGTFASRASNPLSQKQRRGRDGRRLHVSGGDGRSVLGHAQAAELTRVQGLLVAAHADREDCLRRAENAEAHVAKLRAELDHLRQALATQAPTVHACRHPPPAPASATSARDANDQAGSSRSSRSAHDLGRNEMGHGVGADDGFNASSELPILNSTLQRYVMALRMAIDGVSPPDDDGGQPNLGPTLLDEDMYTEARERAWYQQEQGQLVEELQALQENVSQMQPHQYSPYSLDPQEPPHHRQHPHQHQHHRHRQHQHQHQHQHQRQHQHPHQNQHPHQHFSQGANG